MVSKLIASELAKIECLNGTNYDMWYRKIKYDLIHDNLNSVIESIPPIMGSNSTDTQKKVWKK